MILNDEFRIKVEGLDCVYCGERASSMDHYPPKSVSYHGLLLPCCLECNSSLGASHPFSFANRCKMAKDNIRRKFKKILNMPVWDSEELDEMSYSMRENIKSCERTKKIVEERLAWNARSYLSSLKSVKDFAAIIAECDIIINSARPLWNRTEGFTEKSKFKEEEEFIARHG